MRLPITTLALCALLSGGTAQAAPVVTNAVLGISIQGLAAITVGGVGTVDVTGSTVTVPAGLVTLGSRIVVPVTGTTAIASLSVSKLSNLGGVFSPGGVSGSELCGGYPPPPNASGGIACNTGGGIGGSMTLTGTFDLRFLQHPLPLYQLNLLGIGQGGSTNSPFLLDAAEWTTGTGRVNDGTRVISTVGAGSPFTLISPAYANSPWAGLVPIFATLSLTNVHLPVPEPSSLLLVGGGIAGLVLLRVRRK